MLLAVISQPVQAFQEDTPPEITTFDLINLINNGRMANGLQPLIVHDILMATAQSTAEIMAANHSGHIGDVRGRVMAAGYGSGVEAWATENFMTGPTSLDAIRSAWADDLHMIPMVNPNYCHLGAGIAENDGVVYYVIQAAYTTYNAGCTGSTSSTAIPGTTTTPSVITTPTEYVSQIVIPVQTVTPQEDGYQVHVVKSGQTLWTIAEAYGVKVEDIMNWNYYVSPDNQEIYIGQKIYIVASEASAPPEPTAPPANPTQQEETGQPTLEPTRTAVPTTAAVTSSPAPTEVQVQGSAVVPQTGAEETPNRMIGFGVIGLFAVGLLLLLFGIIAQKTRA